MRFSRQISSITAALFALIVASTQLIAAELPGMGHLSGNVIGNPGGLLATVMARNVDNDVGFMVYVVDDKYQAVNLFPGTYQVTIRPAVGQVFTDGFRVQSKSVEIVAGKTAMLGFDLKPQKYEPDYVGGMTYKGGWADSFYPGGPMPSPSPDAKVLPYSTIYPPGPGRDIIERTCMGCHTVQMFSYNHHRKFASGRPTFDKAGWAFTVDRMSTGHAFGDPTRLSHFDKALLNDEDRDILVNYLADNFGADSEPRVVQLESEPELDMAALAKAQYVEYRFAATEEMPSRHTHTMGFTVDGFVWVMERGSRNLVWLDPQTGKHKEYPIQGESTSALTVDKDGSVWYGGLEHFDPKNNLTDEYRFDGPNGGALVGGGTSIFDSDGDLWFGRAGHIAKWDRQTDKVSWWEVPIMRSLTYGLTLDHNGKVWFAMWHNSAVASFDPVTEDFDSYRVTAGEPTNIRRPGVDSKNNVFVSTWGSKGRQKGALYRVNPETREIDEFPIGIPYSNPYDNKPDADDNIWVSTDNYLVMFDQETEAMTRYPLTTRSDVPRLAITAEGAVWHALRNAGYSAGYGGTLVAFYPDKDKITTYAAKYAPDNNHMMLHNYDGPMTKVTGATKFSPAEPQNPGAFAEMLRANGKGFEPAQTGESNNLDRD